MGKTTILTILLEVLIVSMYAQTSWTKIDGLSGGGVYDLFINESGNMFASTTRGLYYSDNNGDSWELKLEVPIRSTFQSSDGQVYSLAFNSSLYRGVLSNLVEIGKTDRLRLIRELSDGTLVAYGGTFTLKIYTSSNMGQNWNEVYELTDLNPFSVTYFETGSDDRVYLGTTEGLYRSDDLGVSFYVKNDGVTFEGVGGVNEVVSMTSDVEGNLYRATQTRVFKSEDNGDSWTSIFFDLPDSWIYGGLAVANNDLILLNAQIGQVFKLENNSTSWTLISGFTLSHEYSKELLYNTVTSTFFYPSEKVGIYKSVDQGVSWGYGDNGIQSVSFEEMALMGNKDISLICDYGYRFYSSEIWNRNYFDTHFTRDSQQTGVNLSISDGLMLINGTDAVKYYTSSNGAIWEARILSEFENNRLVLLFNSAFYAFGNVDTDSPITLLRSIDNGENWESVEIEGLETDQYSVINGFIGDENLNILYVSFSEGLETPARLYKIDLTTNTAQGMYDGYVYRMKIASDHSLWGILDLEDGIKVATFDASTSAWQNVYNASTFAKLEIAPNDYILIMEDNGKILVSPTKGRTWRDISIESKGQVGALAMDETGIVYAAVSYDGVYKTSNSIFDTTSPSLVMLSPENDSNLMDNKVTLTLQFDEEIFSQSGKKLKLYQNEEASPFIQIDVSAGVINGKEVSFNVEGLPDNSSIHISLDESAFLDAFDNPSAGILKDDWSFNSRVSVVLSAETENVDYSMIYPLPTSGLLNVSNSIEEIEIYDMQGKFIKLPLQDSKINMSELPSGVYFGKVRKDQKIKVIRIVKN